MSFAGFSDLTAPDFQSPDLTPALQGKGAATANRFAGPEGTGGMIDSTNLNRAWGGDVLSTASQQAQQNLQLANLTAQDQLTANSQQSSGLLQLAGLLGF